MTFITRRRLLPGSLKPEKSTKEPDRTQQTRQKPNELDRKRGKRRNPTETEGNDRGNEGPTF